MAGVNQFTYGLLNPLFAIGMSGLGSLLGLLMATKALGYTGRVRLLIYGSVAFGATGVWVPHMVALLGLSVGGSAVRYNPALVGGSLGVAVLGTAVALFTAFGGRTGRWRVVVGGLLLGATFAGTNIMALLAVRVGGAMTVERPLLIASVATAALAGGAAIAFVVVLRRMRTAAAAAAVISTAVVGSQYLALWGVRVELGTGHPILTGLSPILLFVPLVSFSTTVLVMLWFFTVGSATRQDLHAIFATPHRSIEIEPWMIEEVTTRIGVGITVAEPEPEPEPARRPPAPQPTPGAAPSWRSMPVWGSVVMLGNGRAGVRNRTANSRVDVQWVTGREVPPRDAVDSPARELVPAGAAPDGTLTEPGLPEQPPTVDIDADNPTAQMELPLGTRWRNRRR